MIVCSVGIGNTISLWYEKWCSQPLMNMMTQLFSYAKNDHITLEAASNLDDTNFYEMFHLPMSSMAVQQSNEMLEIISNIHQDNDNKDCWQFLWKGNKYSNRKIYLHLIGNPPKAAPPFQWIWKSCNLPKQKFFFWLLLLDRLNTRDLLIRKNFQIENRRCILCDDEPNEYLQHLFFECDFSRNFWAGIGMKWNTYLNTIEMLMEGAGWLLCWPQGETGGQCATDQRARGQE